MFGIPKKILAITKDKIIAVEVLDPATKKFGRSYEFGWEIATLDLALTEAAKRIVSKSFRILVSDDLSYVVRVQVPPEVKPERVKNFILEKLQEKIPDQIEEGEWDYKELRGKSETRDIIAFVLVKNFARALFGAIEKSGIQVEAIEAQTLAKTRDSNAYIGLALKEDLNGKNEDVLNITPQPVANLRPETVVQESTPEPEVQGRAKQSGSKLKFLIILIPIILLGALFGGLVYFRNNETQTSVSVEETVESATPEPTPTSTPKITLNLAEITVQIQNGSGTVGEAGRVSDLLKAEGFEKITTANASSFDSLETEVQLKSSVKDVFATIERTLNSDYTIKEGEVLSDDFEFDIVIIVGSRL